MTTTDLPGLETWNEQPGASSIALFSGDAGGLTFDQRRCLVRLLKERYISKDSQPDLWRILIRDEETLRSRLNDLFLVLHIDSESEVAYKRQAVPDDSGKRFPTLLHDTPYNREETILLVHLRERLQRERAAGAEEVLVDAEELLDRVAEFRPADATDIAAEVRRATNAIEALKKAGVLHAKGETDRFSISPVLDSLMPLTRLKELLEWLRAEVDPPTTPAEVAQEAGTCRGEA
jgi:hypothetical protein